MKRLAVLIPKLSGGGMERIVSYLSLYAPNDVDIYIILFKKTISYPVKHAIYHVGDYNNIFEGFNVYIKLNRLLRKIKPDALLLFGVNQGLTMALLSFVRKKSISIHNYVFEPQRKRKYKIIYFKLLMSLLTRIFSNKILVVSHPIKHKLIKQYSVPRNKIEVIQNPVDVETVYKLSKSELNNNEYEEIFSNKVIMNIGRLVYQKGQWHLIRLFKKVNEVLPETRLIIRGQGGLENYLRKLVSDLNLDRKVFFLGWKSNPFKYMSRSKLFCLPSLWEGFSNVILEALVCGLPVMSADCLAGPREILAPGTRYKADKLKEPEYGEYGILMPVMDGKMYTAKVPLTWQEEVWADEIIKLLTHPKKLNEYKRKSLKRAFEFDVRKQIQKYFDVVLGSSQT
ncbi:MAG: glycosyltransferase [Nitrososphaerota archaeon]